MRIVISSILLTFFSFFTLVPTLVNAQVINYSVSPIKYEITLNPGESGTYPASITNNGSGTVTMPIITANFEANGTTGTPKILRNTAPNNPNTELASWISLSQSGVTLAPGEQGTINFTINVPNNATPGGHYGAVLFQNNDTSSSSGAGNIAVNVDYGIIILLTVSGDTDTNVNIGNPSIGGSTGGSNSGIQKDDCILGDFTPSNFDGKCFGPVNQEDNDENTSGIETDDTQNNKQDIRSDEPSLFGDNFSINFQFPISNDGNTHVKPDGKVILRNQNGEVIKNIGKQVIVNDRGLIVGEEIVDYLPINDQEGNILPNTTRIFESEWKGFPYISYDSDGNQVIQYWTPSEYYSRQNTDNIGYLMPWQRISEVLKSRNITADIEIEYIGDDGEPIVFNSAEEFEIDYIENEITFNPYVALGLALLLLAGILSFFSIKWWYLVAKNRKCRECSEKIKSHWETCPYCGTIQNKSKERKYKNEAGKEASINSGRSRTTKTTKKRTTTAKNIKSKK